MNLGPIERSQLNAPNFDNLVEAETAEIGVRPEVFKRSPKSSFKKFGLKQVQKFFRSTTRAVIFALLVGVVVAILLTAVRGVPVPIVHDEHSYLLGADTFASGRLANPTHPHWEHFESFHIIQKPSYVSKYQPGHALLLALGQVAGHPIVGSWLMTGMCIASLVWMLTGWLPRKYFWVVLVFATLHPGIQIVWGQSYWGGSLAMTGSALLLGALGRLDQKLKVHLSLVAGVGVLMLANSRPFEGAILVATVCVALIWKLTRYESWKFGRFITQIILPAGIVLMVGAGFMLTYNKATTGHWSKMPYQLHEAEYGWTPLFIWETPGEKPEYRHPTMETFHATDIAMAEKKFGSKAKLFGLKTQTSYAMAKFFCGGTIVFALFGMPFVWRRPRYRFAILIGLPAFLAALATPWAWAHYCAPAAPIIILVFIASLIQVWIRSAKAPLFRTVLFLLLPLFHLVWFVSTYSAYASLTTQGWAVDRNLIEMQLVEGTGKDLVFVHYSDGHNPHSEWVYNKADIDASEVVWAREMTSDKNEALIRYYEDRNVWVVEADKRPAVLRLLGAQDREAVKRRDQRLR